MRRLAQVGVLGAVAFTFMYFDVPLPPFPAWLRYDPSEVPALIAAFALGPAAGIAVEAVKGLLISLFRSGTMGGPFGIVMNLLAGMTLVGVAGAYYRVEHTRIGAIRAMGLGIAAMTAVMIVANILLTPIFFGLSRAQVVALVLPALLPFNLVKGILSSVLTYYVYKRVRVYLYEWIADRTVW